MGWICATFGVIALGFLLTWSVSQLLRYRRAHRELTVDLMRHARLCVKCGYDVRANSGRCPECGWPVTPPRPD